MKKIITLLTLAVFTLMLAGCGASTETPPAPPPGASINGPLTSSGAGENFPFFVDVAQPGDPVGIDFRGALTSGSVRAQLVSPSGEVIWEEAVSTPGPFSVNTVVRPAEAGEYRLGLVWDGPVQAQYALQWKPGPIEVPTLSPLALLGSIGMILVAVGFVAYAAVRRLGWGYLGLGALAWVVAVVLKFAWAIPVNTPVYNALTGLLPEAAALPIFYLYVGALTGVFEVALVWLVLRYTRLGRVSWQRALAFGIGFGAIEALLLGLLQLASVATALAAPSLFPLESLELLIRLNNPLFGLAPIVERLATIFVHILSNLLIFYAVVKHQPRWFWLAFVYKTAVDTVAAFGQFWGLETLGKVWTLEAAVMVFGVIGWLGIRWLRGRYPAPAEEAAPPVISNQLSEAR